MEIREIKARKRSEVMKKKREKELRWEKKWRSEMEDNNRRNRVQK